MSTKVVISDEDDLLPCGSGAPSSPNIGRMAKLPTGAHARKNIVARSSQEESHAAPSPSSQYQQKQGQDNSMQEKEVLSKLPRMERVPSKMYRWNTNEEVAAWLYSSQAHSEWCSLDVRIRPPNGSMLLYHKKGSNYKHDGYVWKKRKDGKLPREDHMRLKVKGVEIIYANYVHSSLVPTFHRRSYWLLSHPDVVLVHYLNTPGEGELADRILPSLRISISQHTRTELLEQLKPMLCYGPLTSDDQHQSTPASLDNASSYEERLTWVNGLIDQARQSKTAPVPATVASQPAQSDLHMLVNGATPVTATTSKSGTPQTVLVTSLGQFLLAIDPQSPEGTALLAAQHQRRAQLSAQMAESETPQESSPSASSESPPAPSQPTTAFAAPISVAEQQQQICRASNGIRSNSCSSASRRVMCSTIMRRQPSAFSDGADDVFRPLTEALTAASSSCSMAEMDPLPLAGPLGLNDSAYCSFADARDDDINGIDQSRMIVREGENVRRASTTREEGADARVTDYQNLLHHTTSGPTMSTVKSKPSRGDPILSAVGEAMDDSANLGLTQEDIATTLRANLAAMIDKPSTELFTALSPTHHNQSSFADTRNEYFRDENISSCANGANGGNSVGLNMQTEEGCAMFLSSGHMLSSPDSSFRLLNQILSGEDYGDEDDTHSIKSGGKVDEGGEEKQPSPSPYFQVNASSENSGAGYVSASAAAFTRPAGSRAASCGSSHGSGTSSTAMRIAESRFGKTGFTSNGDMDDNSDQTGSSAARTSYEEQQRRNSRDLAGHSAVATITDFSPEWSHPQGGAKVLISGPWYSTSHRYHCLFGDTSVPASLVQTGVLRCYCPPHEPGTVSLMVCCDDRVISNAVMFEYRLDQRDTTAIVGSEGRQSAHITPNFWLGGTDSHLCMGLLERLQALERHLGPVSSNAACGNDQGRAVVESGKTAISLATNLKMSNVEERLVRVCKCMSSRAWLHATGPLQLDTNELAHHSGMSVMHFAAALGFARLIAVLYDWCSEKKCALLESELQLTKQDANGRTALMWACVKGKTEVATLLASGCRDSLFIPDYVRLVELPLAAAFRDGHVDLVKQVVHQFVTENGGDPNARDLDTALWVLTSGLVERSHLHYNRRPYIHARRHQYANQQPEQYHAPTELNVNGENRADSRVRKQLSLDSQMIRLSSSSRTVFSSDSHQSHADARPKHRGGNKTGRECMKRASVEGLEELMRHAADESTDACSGNQTDCGTVNSRATASFDVGLNLSSKITRQDSENSSSVASYLSVNELLNMELPMEITVPDSAETPEMWKSLGATSAEHTDGYEAQVQIASLAQQIIDALPDRIKHETFAEECEDMELEQPQSQQPTDHVGVPCEYEPCWTQCGQAAVTQTTACFPASPLMERCAGDFISYRHHDTATPCSSCISPGSARSPGFSLPPADTFFQGAVNDAFSVSSHIRHPHSQRSIPMSPSTLATASPTSSTGVQSAFLFPSSNNITPTVDGVYQHPVGSSDQCCQSQPLFAEAKNLGEFFNATRSRSPLECHFQELTLTDREQRQLYEAAKVIQNAYRQYKQRVMMQTYSDIERQAAVVIQTCYRRYKQYCYFKKLHQAAVLIQKHFRLYKAAKRSKTCLDDSMESTSSNYTANGASVNGAEKRCLQDEEENFNGFTQFLENAVQQAIGNNDTTVLMTAQSSTHKKGAGQTSAGPCIRIQVTPDELNRWKQHLAAARIQNAFRGHRKRQDAAARKIQKFMREARQKLQKARTAISSVIATTATHGSSAERRRLSADKRIQTPLRDAPMRQSQPTTAGNEGIFQPGCQYMQMSNTRN